MNMFLAIVLIALGVILALVMLLIFQMKQYKRVYQIPNKPIDKMDRDEVIRALNSEHLNPTRWIEDLMEVLIWKGVVHRDDFPQPVSIRIDYKKELRKQLQKINGDLEIKEREAEEERRIKEELGKNKKEK